MKKIIVNGCLLMALMVQPACALDSVANSAKHTGLASKHMMQAGAHAVGGVVKAGSTVAALPVIGVGKIGKALEGSGEKMWDYGTTPLVISDDTITAGAPPTLPQRE